MITLPDEVKSYLEDVESLENRAATMVIELINSGEAEWSRDKYKVTGKFRQFPVDNDRPWSGYQYVEIWTANGKDSLSVGVGGYDSAKVDIPKGDQDELWEALEELGLPSYEL